MERSADILDMAQAHVEQEVALRVEQIRRSTQTRLGRAHCLNCGDLIPPARRQHVPGAVRCVACQGLVEVP